MRKTLFVLMMLFVAISATNAQGAIDLNLIKETVQNEKEYFNDILNIYLNDDPYLRNDDVALVYYGQAYTPSYKAGNDPNEESLKSYVSENNYNKIYSTAKKILDYNPVSLNALFYAWRSSDVLGKAESETTSYVSKYLAILEMITTVNDGKSSSTAFRVITPDDQDHIMYGIMDIENIKSRNFDTETLCNIINVEPSKKFTATTMYIDVSIPLTHSSR